MVPEHPPTPESGKGPAAVLDTPIPNPTPTPTATAIPKPSATSIARPTVTPTTMPTPEPSATSRPPATPTQTPQELFDTSSPVVTINQLDQYGYVDEQPFVLVGCYTGTLVPTTGMQTPNIAHIRIFSHDGGFDKNTYFVGVVSGPRLFEEDKCYGIAVTYTTSTSYLYEKCYALLRRLNRSCDPPDQWSQQTPQFSLLSDWIPRLLSKADIRRFERNGLLNPHPTETSNRLPLPVQHRRLNLPLRSYL